MLFFRLFRFLLRLFRTKTRGRLNLRSKEHSPSNTSKTRSHDGDELLGASKALVQFNLPHRPSAKVRSQRPVMTPRFDSCSKLLQWSLPKNSLVFHTKAPAPLLKIHWTAPWLVHPSTQDAPSFRCLRTAGSHLRQFENPSTTSPDSTRLSAIF